MSYSLGLTLYNLANRRAEGPLPEWPSRPKGSLIWLHAPNAGAARALTELGRRLIDEDHLSVLLTCPEPLPECPGLIQAVPPHDTAAAARAFLNHWRPDLGILSHGELRPALIHEAHLNAIPMVLADASTPDILGPNRSWLPGLTRGLLGQFQHIVTLDETAARAFRRAGAPVSVVEAAGKMEEGTGALPCTEAEREALARMLKTRPVWLAAGLPAAEEQAVLAAHRIASRLAHRLLLIIVPDDHRRGPDLAASLDEEHGWAVARRGADEDPEDETQVYIADTEGEFGLWYRLAPITYMGGSLAGPGSLRDPFEPAALGSAILSGPHHGSYWATYARLAEARAARDLKNPADLAEAVSDLLSPDRAARLAHAAWSVSSAGADATERVLALARALMPSRQG